MKANQLTTYTNTEVDTALGLKANQPTTNAQTQVYRLVSSKSDNLHHNSGSSVVSESDK
ncbi:MAG: hypothetical protein ACKPKO_23190 [Candidatus Fonsibacter sp.]